MRVQSFVPEEAVGHWRAAVDRLLAVGTQAGRAAGADFGTLGEEDPLMQALDDAIAGYKHETEQLLCMDGADASSPQSMALLGGFQAVEVLLRSSEEPSHPAVWADDGHLHLDAWIATLDDYVWAMTGRAATPEIQPVDLDATLDELAEAGAEELISLAQSRAMWDTLTEFGSGIVAFGGVVAAQAFEAVAGAVNAYRRRVLELLQWIVKRLRQLMPEDFRLLVDERLAWLKETVSGQDPARIAEVLGQVLGRSQAQEAWGDAESDGRDLTQEERLLAETVAGHLGRIGFIGSGRKKMESIAGMLTAWVSLAVPQVQIVTGAAALTVFAFILSQVHDGFDDIKRLAATS